jgi:hypothetical protein
MPNSSSIFISYSHKDERLKNCVVSHLQVASGHKSFTP